MIEGVFLLLTSIAALVVVIAFRPIRTRDDRFDTIPDIDLDKRKR